jgi:nucleolar protein 12
LIGQTIQNKMDETNNYEAGDISSTLFGKAEEEPTFFKEPPKDDQKEIEKKKEILRKRMKEKEELRLKENERIEKIEEDIQEKNKRTIFVGNINFESKDTTKLQKSLEKVFSKYGEIQSTRIRSIGIIETKAPKKAAIIKEQFSNKKATVNAYIVYKDEKSCQDALEMNSQLFEERHLIVDLANPEPLKVNTFLNSPSCRILITKK